MPGPALARGSWACPLIAGLSRDEHFPENGPASNLPRSRTVFASTRARSGACGCAGRGLAKDDRGSLFPGMSLPSVCPRPGIQGREVGADRGASTMDDGSTLNPLPTDAR